MKIVILGSGNVATHLSLALLRAGNSIIQVFSRDISHAANLAAKLKCESISDIEKLNCHADLYFFSVSDDAITTLVSSLPYLEGMVVHTSGATGIDVLSAKFKSAGVLYPLQTFSAKRDIDFKNVPLLIEASNQESEDLLVHIASSISLHVQKVNSAGRSALHLAAVLACNFTNHLYALAAELLEKESLSFNLLYPLMEETLAKAKAYPPATVQTGPARRLDINTINKHIDYLGKDTFEASLYILLTDSIIRFNTK